MRSASEASSPSSPGFPAYSAPSRLQTITSPNPWASMISVHATPAAPAPTTTAVTSSGRLPTSFSALSSPASTTIAVPCWSSWKTGMSSSSRSRRSISKQRGAEMSSRLMPPKVGAAALTKATISSTSLVSTQSGKASTPANSLNSIALPSITGMAASGPMSPSPSTAVPSDTTATVLPLMVSAHAFCRSSWMAMQTRADARRVGHREVVARLQRQLADDLDLAALVHEEGAVGDAVDLHALELAHRAHDGLGVVAVGARDRDVAHDLVGLDAHEVDRAQHRVRVGDGVGHARERGAVLRHAQPHREAVGRRRLKAPRCLVRHVEDSR